MANESRRISQLLITTTVSANDRVVVLTDPITNAQSKTVTFNNLTKALSGANSSTKGLVRIGNNVDIDANSTISVQLGTWSFSNSIAYTGDEQNSYIDGKTPAGLKLYNDTKINLNASSSHCKLFKCRKRRLKCFDPKNILSTFNLHLSNRSTATPPLIDTVMRRRTNRDSSASTDPLLSLIVAIWAIHFGFLGSLDVG